MGNEIEEYKTVLEKLIDTRSQLVNKRESIYLEKFINGCHFNIAVGLTKKLAKTATQDSFKYVSELEMLSLDLAFINRNLENDCSNISALIKNIDKSILEINTLINC